MFFRGMIGDSVRRNGGMEKKKQLPGKAYARFFEGYTELSVPSAKGKRNKIVRIYTADYYRHVLNEKQYFLLKIFYPCLYLFLLYCFVTAAVEPVTSNSAWYIALPQTFCVFFLGWLFLGMINYLFAGREMTIYFYQSSTRNVKRAAAGLCVSSAVLSLMNMLYFLLHFRYMPFAVISCIIRFSLCFGTAALIYYVENNMPYEKVLNKKGEQINGR